MDEKTPAPRVVPDPKPIAAVVYWKLVRRTGEEYSASAWQPVEDYFTLRTATKYARQRNEKDGTEDFYVLQCQFSVEPVIAWTPEDIPADV